MAKEEIRVLFSQQDTNNDVYVIRDEMISALIWELEVNLPDS